MAHLDDTIDIKGLLDIEPPFGQHLSGVYKKGFAYVTIKDRLPVILTGVIDTISRNKEEIIRNFGGNTSEELKKVIGDVSKLRNELMTNKRLTPLILDNSEADGDATIWNDYLKARESIEGRAFTWFNTVWLLSECYMYRRLNQTLVLTNLLKTYDPFEKQKQNAFMSSLNSIKFFAKHIMGLLNRTSNVSTAERKHEFVKLLKLNLWGNRSDLSLSGGAESNVLGNPLQLLDSFDTDLLVDDTKVIWDLLNKSDKSNVPKIVDIIFDNAGYELFADLCLASFIIAHGLAHKVRFYVKRIPWFVSDVNLHDFNWTIDNMRNSTNEDLKAFGDVCAEHLRKDEWTVELESFWTEPYDISHMKEKSPALYGKLAEAVLVIFKGDLNYRKLMCDIKWEFTKPFSEVLLANSFLPTDVASLRTVKADVCVGLAPGQAEKLLETDENWMTTGKYGVIHATHDIPCICPDKD